MSQAQEPRLPLPIFVENANRPALSKAAVRLGALASPEGVGQEIGPAIVSFDKATSENANKSLFLSISVTLYNTGFSIGWSPIWKAAPSLSPV